MCTPLAAPATQDHDSPRIAFVIDADPQFRPESLAAPVRLLAAAVSREHPTARYAVTWIRDENPTSWTSFSNALGDLGRLKKGLDDGINELRARAGATKPASIEVGFDAARREIGDGGGATAMVLISSQLARPGERVVRVQPTDLDVGKALRAIRGELERRRDPKPEPERVPEEGTSASDFASNADFTRSWVRVSPPDTGAVVTRHRLVSRAEIGRAVEALGLAARYASCTLAEVGDLPIDPQRRLAELANLNAQSGVPAILSLTPSDIRASPRRGDLVAALRDAEQRLDDLQRHPDLNDGCTLIPDHLLSFPASCGDP